MKILTILCLTFSLSSCTQAMVDSMDKTWKETKNYDYGNLHRFLGVETLDFTPIQTLPERYEFTH